MTDEGKPAGRSDDTEPYNPYLHRTHPKPASDFASLANFIKTLAGTGIFALPNAFASVGMLIGIVGTITVGVLITVALHLFLKIHDTMCVQLKQPILTYDRVVVAALTSSTKNPWTSERFATLFVDVALIAAYVGVGAVYIVFVAGIVQESIDSEKSISQAYYALMLFPFFLLMNMSRYLRDIASMSVIGNILFMCATTIGVVYALKDGIGDDWKVLETDISRYPKYMGIVFFSICSPGVALAIQHDMKKPWNYTKLCGIVNWGMAFIITFYILVGAVGYLKWGTKSLGNFIRNHPENDGATMAALIMQGLSIYSTYGLQCYVPIKILRDQYALPAIEKGECKGTLNRWDLIIRFGLTFLTCILAAAIPKLDLFIGLVGALCTTTLATLIPMILYILINYDTPGRFKWKLIIGCIILLVGLVTALTSIITNSMLLFKFFQTGE